jgi:hypothetical protein
LTAWAAPPASAFAIGLLALGVSRFVSGSAELISGRVPSVLEIRGGRELRSAMLARF